MYITFVSAERNLLQIDRSASFVEEKLIGRETGVTMKKISIKAVDGSRFDYIDKEKLIEDAMTLLNKWPVNAFYGFPVDGGYKFFNQRNIVSYTETEIWDA